MRLAALVALAALALAAISCAQAERTPGTPPIDPRRAAPAVSLDGQLLPTDPLESNEDFDRWEAAVMARADARMVFVLYRPICEELRSPRAFVRWILFTWLEELPAEARQYVQKYSKVLEDSRADSPDLRYVAGVIAWRQLVGGKDQVQVPAAPPQPALVDTIVKSWGELAEKWPDWKGPHGVTSAELSRRVKALQATLSPRAAQPPAPKVAPPADEFWSAFEDFYRRAEDLGTLKACDRVDAALAVKNDPLPLGDAYAHCVLDRDNAPAALAQLVRMVDARVAGGIPAVLVRLRRAATADPTLAEDLQKFETSLRAVASADPAYADRCGLTGWLVTQK